jgi:hypothetical protein
MKKASASTTAKKDLSTSKVAKVNLSKYAEQLSKITVKEKNKREHLYIYPEGFTEQMINSEVGKKHRNKMRNILKRFTNNIFVFAKSNQIDKLQTEVNLFKSFYKENYRIQDFSLNSITNAKDEKKENIQLMLNIVKDMENANVPPVKKERKSKTSKK